jgi:hypothetical protein
MQSRPAEAGRYGPFRVRLELPESAVVLRKSMRIHWGRILVAAFLSEVVVIAIYLLLRIATTLAGVPDIAKPMTTLDYIDAMVSSFVMVFLFTLWLGKRIESRFVLHGALVGIVAALLFTILWTTTTPSLAQPAPYVVAHVLKVLGGIAGGLVVERRKRRVHVSEASRQA